MRKINDHKKNERFWYSFVYIMKFHRNIAWGIITGLNNTLIDKRPGAKVIKKLLKNNPNWGSRDRKIISQAFYDIIRKKRFFHALTEKENNEINPWSLLGCWMIFNKFLPPQWEEFNNIDIKKLRNRAQILIQNRKYKYSIPDWLDQMGVEDFGEAAWEREIASLNTPAHLIIRVNTIFTTVEKLKNILENNYNIVTQTIPNYPYALIFKEKQSLQAIKEYKLGWFVVQDANSQKITPWLKPKSGKYYIDACAGAGGKSLHLADLTKDAANIVALDIYNSKLDELRKRCYQNNVNSIKAVDVDNKEILKNLEPNADGVLIDAPCSGIGVLKRNPDAKWLMNPERLTKILENQRVVLQTYAPFVKKGGCLIYATCSILDVENKFQVINFLKTKMGSQFELDREHTYFSHLTGFDGFYCARLIKKCE